MCTQTDIFIIFKFCYVIISLNKHVIMQNTGLLVVVLICLSTTFTSAFMKHEFYRGPLYLTNTSHIFFSQ